MMKSILFLALTGLLGLQNLAAQKQGSPMVALRKDMVWHFYDNQNKLMFNHEIIAPTTVSSFKLGYSRVRALTAVKEELSPQISYNLVDANGYFLNLTYPKPDSINWEIHDIFEFEPKKRAIEIYNPQNNTLSFFNHKNKLLPTQPLFYTQYLGEGLIAGFGKMPLIVSPDADYSYGMGPENEYGYNYDFTSLNDFEIWSLSSGQKIKTLKVQELGQATNGIIPAKKDELWGLINTKGQWLCKPKFNNIGQAIIRGAYLIDNEPNRTMAAGLVPARLTKNEDWGLIDQKGNWVVEPNYDAFIHFTPYCWLTLTPTFKTIILFDNTGKQLKIIAKNDVGTAPRYITSCDNINTNNPILLLKFEGLTGFQIYNTKTNTIGYACEKCDYLTLNDSTILVKEGTNQYLIDTDGKTIARLLPTTEASYKAPLAHGIFAFLDSKTKKYGYTDRQGNIVITPTLTSTATTISPDFLYYSEGSYYFFIDHKGNIINKYFLDDSSDWEILVPLYDNDWMPIER